MIENNIKLLEENIQGKVMGKQPGQAWRRPGKDGQRRASRTLMCDSTLFDFTLSTSRKAVTSTHVTCEGPRFRKVD